MLHLLKEKSKIQWKAKDRKKYEPLKPGIKLQKEGSIDFAAELKDLNARGADAYLQKTGQ